MNPDGNAPVLHYSTPRVIFAGAQKSRTWVNILAIVVLLPQGILFGAFAVRERSASTSTFAALAFTGTVFVGLAAYSAWAWWTRQSIRVEVNEDGIIQGMELWPGQRIAEIGGYVLSPSGRGSIQFYFKPTNGTLHKPFVTPALTFDRFDHATTELQQSLKSRFPLVKVVTEPANPS